MKNQFALWIACSGLCVSVLGDSITFTSGDIVEGTILQTNGATVLVQRQYATFNYPTNLIRSVRRQSNGAGFAASTNFIPPWSSVLRSLTKQSWAYGIKQIPATIIDTGILKNVPYTSFRCGANYEVNVYGDPEDPAGLEIGVYGGLVKDSFAQDNCLEFIVSQLSSGRYKESLRTLKRSGEISNQDSVTLEVTPPTAEDAYGGWWVSVYSTSKLDGARASEKEMAAISEPVAPSSFNPNDSQWNADELKQRRTPVVVYVPQQTAAVQDSPVPTAGRFVSSTASSSGGRVYVRGYTRKDGTYVHPYTRRR